MVRGLHHLAIQCAELPRCERFYREVLGLEVIQRGADADGRERSVWLGLGDGAILALERTSAPLPGVPWSDPRPGLHLVALRIGAGDRAAWEARLAAAGVDVVHRTRWTLYVRDPEGNRVGLSHHPDEVP
jgi:catechol 2,3-dioxygenase-like lactoylglutathione lyase family enzyme